MTDKPTYQDRLRSMLHPSRTARRLETSKWRPKNWWASCGAFGYLRGIRDHASAVELRFRDGNSTVVPLQLGSAPGNTTLPKGCC